MILVNLLLRRGKQSALVILYSFNFARLVLDAIFGSVLKLR